MTQPELWDDLRLPSEYARHYQTTGMCINCPTPLKHPLHAYRHWKKFHRFKVAEERPLRGYQYLVWKPGPRAWMSVSFTLYRKCQKAGLCTARVKPSHAHQAAA